MSDKGTFSNDDIENTFLNEYAAIIQRLIKQKAIMNMDIQFHESNKYSLEDLQDMIWNIFNGRLDTMIYQMAQKEIFKNAHLYDHSKLLIKKLSPFQVMNFAQVIFYKTLPCPKYDLCPNRPREIAPSNQYEDEELECPYYHHEKDRRRLTIARKVEDEFVYKANYDKSKCDPCPDKFSKNYFESMFHPIYYRLFQCKRIHCENSFFCPFFHTKDEKNAWDEIFLTYIKKSRDVYTKEKKEKVYPTSLRNINDEYINKFEVIAINRKSESLSLPQSQIMLERDSTPSSSSNRSQKEPSPDQDKVLFQDWLSYPNPNYQRSGGIQQGQHQTQKSKTIIYPKNTQGIPKLLRANSDKFENNEDSMGTFSLFGNYSNNLWNIRDQDKPIEHQPTNNNNNTKSDSSALDQYFNKHMIQNINNLRLHH